MPVKNVKRKTNDGFEGVITGLNDKEKEIIAKSVDNVEANPTDEATDTLEKLKVGNTTYGIGEQVYSINHEISLSMIPTIVNGIFLDLYLADDKTALNQFIETGKGIVKANLKTPIGTINVNLFPIANNVYACSYPLFTDLTDYGGSVFNILNVWLEGSNPDPKLDFSITPLIPVMPFPPSDAATKTYTLKVVNGTITWVEG